MNIDLEKTLYSSCRVRADRARGSATIVASLPLENKYETYAFTNHHVVEENIKVKKEYDPLVGKEVPRELKSVVEVDFPRFKGDRVLGYNSVQADILLYDKHQDIALLRFRDVAQYPAAVLIPKKDVERLQFLQTILTIGAALGEHPIGTLGLLSGMQIEIDNFEYWISTAQSIFGNSGGGVFAELDGVWYFLGIPSRIAVLPIGFSQQAITHMGYFVPPHRIHKWLEDTHYQYLYDTNFTKAQCDKAREAKKAEEMRKLLLSGGETTDSRGQVGTT